MSDRDPYDLDQIDADADLRRVTIKLASENEDTDFVWLMSGPKGRRIVRRLLTLTKVFSSSFHPNTMEMSRQEGSKEVGYWLLDHIQKLCPTEYHTMMQET